MAQHIIVQTIKSLLIDAIIEIVYFPIWWYTKGLKGTLIYVFNSLKNSNRNLSLTLLLRSLFKPMFGQYDRQGRIISFFMRLILVLTRLIVFILLVIFNILVIIFWIVLPLVVVYGVITNFKALWNQ